MTLIDEDSKEFAWEASHQNVAGCLWRTNCGMSALVDSFRPTAYPNYRTHTVPFVRAALSKTSL